MQEIQCYQIILILRVMLDNMPCNTPFIMYLFASLIRFLTRFICRIKSVPSGESHVSFQFVAAVTANVPKGDPMPGLTFVSTKAVSYPGGAKFKPLDICEIDPRGEGCDPSLDD